MFKMGRYTIPASCEAAAGFLRRADYLITHVGCAALRAAWPYGFRLVVTPCLMWAISAVHTLPKLAIHAQNLECFGEIAFL
jgi:hypothetical protein